MKKNYLLILIVILTVLNSNPLLAQWAAVGTGMNGTVNAITIYSGNIYAGGQFSTAGGTTVNYIAKWDGTSWTDLGGGVMSGGEVKALCIYNGELYAGGSFNSAGGISANNIAKWNGTTWSAVGTGTNVTVDALAVYNNELYAGGSFTIAGGISTTNVAKWDGTAWSSVGAAMNGEVFSLAVFNGNLYAGGAFHTAGGSSANCFAKYNGSAWSSAGTGMNQDVLSMIVYGSDLIIGGKFVTVDGVNISKIVKYNGTAFSSLGTGCDGHVKSLGTFGTDLYAGGQFTHSGGVTTYYISQWNGSAWSDVGGGTLLDVYSFCEDATNHKLYVGGAFGYVGPIPGGLSAAKIATWAGGPGITAPGAPTTLVVTPVPAPIAATGDMSLSWTDNSTTELGFKIERGTDGINFTLIDSVTANVVSYNNTGLTGGTNYYYRVAAFNAAGISAYSNVANGTSVISGIEKSPIQKETIRVCPTLGKGWFALYGIAENTELAIFSISGELIYSEKTMTNRALDLSSHPNGIYFIRCITGTEVVTRKIVITK